MGNNAVFEKVLVVGPNIQGKGGISSVLQSHRNIYTPFNYVSTNSAKKNNGILKTLIGLFYLMMAVIKIPYYRWIKKVQIVHIHGACGKSFVRKTVMINYSKILGYKIVYHSHGAEFKEYAQKVGVSKIKIVLDKCDCVVVLSESWKCYFTETFNLSNVCIINNIVEPVSLLSQKEDKNGSVKLLFLGLIGDRKGLFDLLNVLASHRDEFVGKLKLIIGGNGEINRLNGYISEHSLDSIVDYVGWVSGEKKNDLIKQSDIMILPSYNEGLPIFILEAMANAKPVISTIVGGIPEVVHHKENGYLIAPGDKEGIYKALKFYVNNPENIVKHGECGNKMVTEFYPENVKAQLLNLYNGILLEPNNI